MGVEERTALTVALRGVYRLGEGTNPSCLTTASSFRYPGAGSSWRLVGCLGALSRSIVEVGTSSGIRYPGSGDHWCGLLVGVSSLL